MAAADVASGRIFLVLGERTRHAVDRQKNISGRIEERVDRARKAAGYVNSLPKSRKRKIRKPVER